MRIALFGAGGDYSATVLEQLLYARGCEVVLVVVPRVPPGGGLRGILRRMLVAHATRPLRSLARRRGIPTMRFDAAGDFPAALRITSCDLIVVASFPHFLPASVRDVARFGAVNVHPSLLPRHRGVDPLFWTFFEDDRWTGVTVHRIDDGVDSGEVIVQASHAVARGTTSVELTRTLARLGGEILIAHLETIAHGGIRGTPQDESSATTDPLPSTSGWRIDWTCWPAERVWHFLCGVGATAPRLVDSAGAAVMVGPATRFILTKRHRDPGTIERIRAGLRISTFDGVVETARPPLSIRALHAAAAVARRMGLGRSR